MESLHNKSNGKDTMDIPSRNLSNLTITSQCPQQREEENSIMQHGHQSVLVVEARQNDDILSMENSLGYDSRTTSCCCLNPSPSIASLTNLLIENDSATGATEVQLKPVVTTATTPPASPMTSSSFHESFVSYSKPQGSCQRRGRFLVWPASPTQSRRSSVTGTSPTS